MPRPAAFPQEVICHYSCGPHICGPCRASPCGGETIYSNQSKMRQCLCKAVCGNVVGDIIRGGLGGIAGVAAWRRRSRHIPASSHSPSTGCRPACRYGRCTGGRPVAINVLTPFFSAGSTCTVDSGRALAWNGSSVPPISKKCGLDLCHGGAPYSRLRLRPISAISALRASSLPSRMASTAWTMGISTLYCGCAAGGGQWR